MTADPFRLVREGDGPTHWVHGGHLYETRMDARLAEHRAAALMAVVEAALVASDGIIWQGGTAQARLLGPLADALNALKTHRPIAPSPVVQR